MAPPSALITIVRKQFNTLRYGDDSVNVFFKENEMRGGGGHYSFQ